MALRKRRPPWGRKFVAFIMRGNVVDLARGIIIGSAFTTIADSLIKDVFKLLPGLLTGGIDFTNIFITLKRLSAPTLDAAKAAGAVTINIGVFF
jgi:large conductance mechanosensitive channel